MEKRKDVPEYGSFLFLVVLWKSPKGRCIIDSEDLPRRNKMIHQKFYCDYDGPIAETKAGKLRGYRLGKIYYFLGVRYGTAARFRSPEPVKPFSGVADCFVTGDACPLASRGKSHSMSGYEAMLMQGRQQYRSEDCLNLNLWTPTLSRDAKKPVIVWISGGGFHSGAVNETEGTDGANLSEYADAVVVSVNHRLAILGFLDLSPFDPVRWRNTGNKGLEDLVLALEWIRENIESFGGDPDNVTLIGHSGGACKLWALMQTPAADGLFHKCVMESGCAGNMTFPRKGHNGYEIVHKTLEKLGLSDSDAVMLESMDYEKLLDGYLAAYAEMSAAYMADGIYRYVGKTVLANDYFAGDPFVYGLREESRKIPCIIGSAFAEQQSLRLNVAAKKYEVPREEQIARIREIYGEKTETVAELFERAYPGKSLLDLVNYETVFRTQILRWCERKAEYGAPCWLYVFALESPFNGGLPAHHGADIPFALHNVAKMPAAQIPGISERVEEEFSGAVSAFARYGDPNHRNLPHWDPYTSQMPATMVFDFETQEKMDFDRELVALNNKCVPWRRFPI